MKLNHDSQKRKEITFGEYQSNFQNQRDKILDNIRNYNLQRYKNEDQKKQFQEERKLEQMTALEKMLYSQEMKQYSQQELNALGVALDQIIAKYMELKKAKENMQQAVRKNPKILGDVESIYNYKPYLKIMQRLDELSANMITKQQQINDKTKQTYEWTKKIQDLKKERKEQSARTLQEEMKKLGGLGLDKVMGIQTNALTSRGGWAGGVRNIASQLQINKRIADYSGKQVTLLQQIKKVVQNAGRI